MTEDEWLTTNDLTALLAHRSTRSARKRRLLSCACARVVLHLLDDERFPAAVEAAERFADRQMIWADLKANQRKAVAAATRDLFARRVGQFIRDAALAVAETTRREANTSTLQAVRLAAGGRAGGAWHEAEQDEMARQAGLLHDLFGNPFRPVAFDPGWRSETAVALARGMYDARDFAIMPVLADALDDAGCDHPDILAHCRDPQQIHVRGCWVVDLVLGRA